jgi:hypothetical protein
MFKNRLSRTSRKYNQKGGTGYIPYSEEAAVI